MSLFRVFSCSLVIACALPALAEAKIDLKPKTTKLEDPGSATPLLYKSPATTEALGKGAKNAVRASATCTDSLGVVVKQGDKGYESCLRNIDKSRIQDSSEKNPSSVGITFGN